MKEGVWHKTKSKVVLWASEQGNWHFAGVQGKLAEELRETYGKSARGFGSLPVLVKIGKTEWKTSIFWDSRSKGYLLPLKAAVRRAEGIMDQDEIEFQFQVRLD